MFLPDYLSYSAVSSYEECPRRWYLRYAQKARPRGAWFFSMGSAVHECIEVYLKTGDVPEFKDVFYKFVAEQMKADSDFENWMFAGSAQDPVVKERAVELGKTCVERAVKFLEDVTVWEIEYRIKLTLPGCDIPVLAYIDILGEHRKHGPLIVDWKSGKNKPKNIFQLETYKALTLMDQPRYGGEWKDFNGYWGMLHPEANPKTDKARFVDLSHVDPVAIGARYQRAYEGMKKKVYPAKTGFGCGFCVMQDNCIPNAGLSKRARYYDKAETEGFPF